MSNRRPILIAGVLTAVLMLTVIGVGGRLGAFGMGESHRATFAADGALVQAAPGAAAPALAAPDGPGVWQDSLAYSEPEGEHEHEHEHEFEDDEDDDDRHRDRLPALIRSDDGGRSRNHHRDRD